MYKVKSKDNYGETEVLHRKEILDRKESFQDDDSLSNESGSVTKEDIFVVRESRNVQNVSTCEDNKNRCVQNSDERNAASVAYNISNSTEENVLYKTNEVNPTEIDNENVLKRSNRSTVGKHSNHSNYLDRYYHST